MAKNKPFTRTELKILVYNKMKIKGISHDEAVKEVKEEVQYMKESDKRNNGTAKDRKRNKV